MILYIQPEYFFYCILNLLHPGVAKFNHFSGVGTNDMVVLLIIM